MTYGVNINYIKYIDCVQLKKTIYKVEKIQSNWIKDVQIWTNYDWFTEAISVCVDAMYIEKRVNDTFDILVNKI